MFLAGEKQPLIILSLSYSCPNKNLMLGAENLESVADMLYYLPKQ
jgi:hypothetical protein